MYDRNIIVGIARETFLSAPIFLSYIFLSSLGSAAATACRVRRESLRRGSLARLPRVDATRLGGRVAEPNCQRTKPYQDVIRRNYPNLFQPVPIFAPRELADAFRPQGRPGRPWQALLAYRDNAVSIHNNTYETGQRGTSPPRISARGHRPMVGRARFSRGIRRFPAVEKILANAAKGVAFRRQERSVSASAPSP